MDKKVTVIVPTYKKYDNLKENLVSIYNQTYSNIELIVTDDGSDNYNPKIIEDIVNECNIKIRKLELTLIHHKNNIGTVKNLNNAIKKSKGEYIFFLAQDDRFYTNNVIEKVVKEFQNYLICTTERVVLKEENEIEIFPKRLDLERLNKKNKYKDLLINGNFISGACTYYKKEVFEKYGFFDENIRLLEDFPYYLEIFRNNLEIKYLPIKSIVYSVEGISNQDEKKLKLIDDFQKVYQREIERNRGYFRRYLKYKKECYNYRKGLVSRKIIKLKYFDIYILEKIKVIEKVLMKE